MKAPRILIIAIIILLIISFVGLIIFVALPDEPSDEPVDNPSVDDVILPLSEDAGQAYIDKLYFVGDSTTYHFFKGGIDRSHIFVPESLTLMLSSDILSITVGETGLTIPDAIKNAGCEIVIITVGVNGADRFSEVQYKTYYKKLIDAIQEASPSTKIILQSVFPVTKEYSDRDIGITNAGIDRLNEWVKEIASDEGLKYLDTQSILKDADGAQIAEYNEDDGVHMNKQAYEKILLYIRTHALK